MVFDTPDILSYKWTAEWSIFHLSDLWRPSILSWNIYQHHGDLRIGKGGYFLFISSRHEVLSAIILSKVIPIPDMKDDSQSCRGSLCWIWSSANNPSLASLDHLEAHNSSLGCSYDSQEARWFKLPIHKSVRLTGCYELFSYWTLAQRITVYLLPRQ